MSSWKALSQPHGSQFPGYSYWMLTLGYGLAHIRAVLAWSEQALTFLNDKADSEGGPAQAWEGKTSLSG